MATEAANTPGIDWWERTKEDFKHLLLDAAGIRRVHIVGCARSGTTMLHYAMVAFADTMLHDTESSVWGYPSLSAALDYARRYAFRPRVARYLITKRSYSWFEPAEINRLLHSALRHGIFVINIVRDPRDVLTSFKSGHDGFYVEVERWRKSVEATDVLLERLRGSPRLLQLRYEDVVCDPEGTAHELIDTIGVRFRPNLTSFAALKENLAILGQNAERAHAMHGARSFDTTSIGRWRSDPEKQRFVDKLFEESAQGEILRRFMTAHGYDQA